MMQNTSRTPGGDSSSGMTTDPGDSADLGNPVDGRGASPAGCSPGLLARLLARTLARTLARPLTGQRTAPPAGDAPADLAGVGADRIADAGEADAGETDAGETDSGEANFGAGDSETETARTASLIGLGAALHAASLAAGLPADPLPSGGDARTDGTFGMADTSRVNPKWGAAAVEAAAHYSPGASTRTCQDSAGPGQGYGLAGGSGGTPPGANSGTPPGGSGGTPPGGSWIWLPGGFAPEKPWRKRHPVLFWGGVVLILALTFTWGRFSGEDGPLAGPKIAVISVEGIILDAGDIVTWMEKVRKDSSYKAAILRINSPGGAVGPSQEIYSAAKRLAKAKPVVASMGALGASGGYYAALGANEIVAGPSTLTASIGVKMQVPNFEALMRTIGISETTLATGSLKDAGSSWREMTPEEEDYFRTLITDMYDEFIAAVALERNMPLEEVRKLADGRAMTGRQAHAAGLVDTLGDFPLAVRKARELAGVTEEMSLVYGPEKNTSFLEDVIGSVMRVILEQRAAAERPVFFY